MLACPCLCGLFRLSALCIKLGPVAPVRCRQAGQSLLQRLFTMVAACVQAGLPGAITVATNMAGRGTDICLGGDAQGLLTTILHWAWRGILTDTDDGAHLGFPAAWWEGLLTRNTTWAPSTLLPCLAHAMCTACRCLGRIELLPLPPSLSAGRAMCHVAAGHMPAGPLMRPRTAPPNAGVL